MNHKINALGTNSSSKKRRTSETISKNQKRVRLGCVLSPDPFSLYSESIMREIKEMPEISVGGH
jgi:hypothetical protein